MLIEDFNSTIDLWIKELDQYEFTSLCAKPSVNSWSLGQLYMHLIEDTEFYVGQIKICISSDENQYEKMSSGAKQIFINNDFPDEQIEGAPSNSSIPQPDSKEQLMISLTRRKDEMNKIEKSIEKSVFKGKTRHPGLGYFDANEWLQFAEMHFRHHLRQKKRIDDFLKRNKYAY